MAAQRLLCGALQRCGTVPALLRHVQQEVWRSSLHPRVGASGLSCSLHPRVGASGLSSGFLVHAGLQLAARQPAARRSLCTSTQPSRDVTLFEHDKTRFFRLLFVFCGGQVVFWTNLAYFAYTGLRDTACGGQTAGPGTAEACRTTTGLAGLWSFQVNLGSDTWRYGFTLGCLAVGAAVVWLGALFCQRSVSKVVLHQGGKMVTVRTQSPLGPDHGRRITVPLSQVACYAHRQESPSFIPLRVKGHKFYFLLDKEGTVSNSRLFDTTVGAYRPL